MSSAAPPVPGDFTAWVVGLPGPDIDYALCVARDGERALLRFQPWQRPGPWCEEWVPVIGAAKPGEPDYGCWATQRLGNVGDALRAERARLFPEAPVKGR